MKRTWIYIINPMLTATDGSYLSAMNLSVFHDSALYAVNTDPFFGPLYTAYHPIHLALKTAFDAWTAQGHTQSGQTLNLTQLLDLLSGSKIDQWDIAIQAVYNKKTPQYKALLPHRRIPFQGGKQLERMEAVKDLGVNLAGISALASVKTAVDAFYTQLDGANTAQKAGKTSTGAHSDALETARVNMCNAQYANLGALINHFSAAPENIAAYFDLKTIRKAGQVHFIGHIKPRQVHAVVKHTFDADDEVKLENTGTTELQFGLMQTKDAKHALDAFTHTTHKTITLKPGEQQTLLASSLGDLTYTFLMVYNPHTVEKGEFTVELV
ncbi:MAG: hypothetical protein HY958_00190 [Bacteroidia bacterium]|nr:hypothetical protein [Bacteroidia bacterium]